MIQSFANFAAVVLGISFLYLVGLNVLAIYARFTSNTALARKVAKWGALTAPVFELGGDSRVRRGSAERDHR